MNSPSSYLPPGPKAPDYAALSNASSYPPPPAFFRNRSLPMSCWDPKLPLSQSRPYVSPDPSPLEERFDHHIHTNHPGNQHHGHAQIPAELNPTHFPPPLSHHPREFPFAPPFLHSRPADPSAGIDQGSKLHLATPAPSHIQLNDNQNHGNEVDPYYNPVVVAPHRQQRKPKGSKKVEGKQPTFLTKLYGILNQHEYSHIIRWDESGEAIIIENPEELADKILPVVYRQSRFASFSRQLNIYGFNRKLSLRHVERGICDPDASTWSHPFLKSDSTKAAILSFKRRVPPRPSQAQKRRLSMEQEGLSPTSSEHSVEFQSPTDAYQHYLLPDVDEEKPVFFPHHRESLAYSGSYPAPEYYAYEQTSPTAIEFDYDLSDREREQRRRLSISVPHRPLELECSRPPIKAEPVFYPADPRDGPGGIPQSAPANTSSYPIPIKVTQQHIRTRSVQGEPPSAMLYSPSSPYNAEPWLAGDVPEPSYGTRYQRQDLNTVQQQQTNITGPTFDANDASTWARRGFADLTTGNLDMLQSTSRLGSSPQSLPNDFGSHGMNYPNGLAIASQSFSALSPDSPTTVSPGVYQSGFSYPSTTRPSYVPISPKTRDPEHGLYSNTSQPTVIPQTRHERRISLSSSPYNPRAKAPSLSFTGSLRTIASRRGSEVPFAGLALHLDDIGQGRDEEEQALPSASIKLADAHPFEGILRNEAENDLGRD